MPSARRRFDELELAHRWDWKTQRSGPLWWRHLVDATVNTPHRDLRLDSLRHRAAAVGLVNESPLYDVDLIEFCLQLPPELAFDRRFGRPLARESMAGLIPDSVRLQTQKANFSPFCATAILGADALGIERLLLAGDAEIGVYVDMDYVETLWRSGQPGAAKRSTSWGTAIWRLAAAECWLRLERGRSAIDDLVSSGDVPRPSVEGISR